jgi:hypothetical protein
MSLDDAIDDRLIEMVEPASIPQNSRTSPPSSNLALAEIAQVLCLAPETLNKPTVPK